MELFLSTVYVTVMMYMFMRGFLQIVVYENHDIIRINDKLC